MSVQTRRTKIVCTIGPSSSSPEMLSQLITAGMDVARLNFSHGSYADHAAVIANVRQVSQQLGKPVAILQDLQGPKIRTGKLKDGQKVVLQAGSSVVITSRPVIGDDQIISTSYTDLPNDVKVGDRILLSDGLIELLVKEVSPPDVQCLVINGGLLGEKQGINLPGVAVSAPAMTPKDREDLDFGVSQGVDYIALSFVRRPADLEAAHAAIAAAQARHGFTGVPIPLIAKIEKPEAITHLDDILRACDGVMVARGDLGVEMPLEQVPLIQKRIIKRANELEIPVITATQMLESMIVNPRPTRAEVSDVANAILDGTDAVMLSGETAMGKYPVETVSVMSRIACETESRGPRLYPKLEDDATTAQTISHAASTLAQHAQVKYIIVFTRSGASAQLMSKDRPKAPILAMTPDISVLNRLSLWWGVSSHRAAEMEQTEDLVEWVDAYLRENHLAQNGELIVVMGGMPVGRHSKTNFIKLHRIGELRERG